jgi:hypothetical protein
LHRIIRFIESGRQQNRTAKPQTPGGAIVKKGKKRCVLVLAAASLAATALTTPLMNTSAAELTTQIGLLKEILDLLRFGMDVHDQYSEVTRKLDMLNPTPNKAAENLEALAKRAESFHPQEFVKPPKLDADHALSRNKAERDAARKDWEDFLNQDRDEIDRLKERRASQESVLKKYRARYEALSKANDMLDALVGNVAATSIFQEELGHAWYRVFEEAKPRMAGIVSDYERIIKDYDRIISRREAEHNVHEAVLRTLKVIQGADNETGKPDNAGTVATQQQISPNPSQLSSIVDAIKGAVSGAGAGVIQQAHDAQSQIGRMRQDRARAEAQARESGHGASTPLGWDSGQARGAGQGTGGGQGGGTDCQAPNCMSYRHQLDK